jgi:hypothetical protein
MKSAAVITIKDVGSMTDQGRKDIAAWLRHQAKMLLKHGDEYSDSFRARYLYLDR